MPGVDPEIEIVISVTVDHCIHWSRFSVCNGNQLMSDRLVKGTIDLLCHASCSFLRWAHVELQGVGNFDILKLTVLVNEVLILTIVRWCDFGPDLDWLCGQNLSLQAMIALDHFQ